MPLNDKRGVAEAVFAGPHRQRGRRHQQVHDPVADGGRHHRHQKSRLAGNLADRASGLFLLLRSEARDGHHPLQDQREQTESDQNPVTGDEFGAQQVFRPAAGLRSEDTAGNAPCHDQGNGLALEVRTGHVCCGEAVVLPRGVIDPHDQGAQHQQPEGLRIHGVTAEQRPENSDQGADAEAVDAANAPHQLRHRQRGHRGTDHIGRHRQGCHRFRIRRRQCKTGETVDSDQDGVIGKEQCLGRAEQRDILLFWAHDSSGDRLGKW